MKKLFLLVALAVILSNGTAFANKPTKQKKEKVRTEQMSDSVRCERLAKHFKLEGKKADVFKAVYGNYAKELKTVRKGGKYPAVNRKELSEAEQEVAVKQRMEAHRKTIEVQEKYLDKFKSVLTIRQIEQLYNGRPRINNKHKALEKKKRIAPEYCEPDSCGNLAT